MCGETHPCELKEKHAKETCVCRECAHKESYGCFATGTHQKCMGKIHEPTVSVDYRASVPQAIEETFLGAYRSHLSPEAKDEEVVSGEEADTGSAAMLFEAYAEDHKVIIDNIGTSLSRLIKSMTKALWATNYGGIITNEERNVLFYTALKQELSVVLGNFIAAL